MVQKIEKKITGYKVATPTPTEVATIKPEPQQVHEALKRPDVLHSSTYKTKTPDSEHAVYITINDIELDGKKHPYEVFINTKNTEHFQWILAMTRLISAVLRKGGNVEFIAEELRAIFDPKGGYFKKGHGFMPSLVAEIGLVLETHMKGLGNG